jgi:hypothetical protein
MDTTSDTIATRPNRRAGQGDLPSMTSDTHFDPHQFIEHTI